MGRSGLRALMRMLVLVLLSALPMAPAGAADVTGVRLAQGEQRDPVSADRAAQIARSATGGRVLAVERRGDGRPWYRVKVLVDGERVRYVAVDAATGRIRR